MVFLRPLFLIVLLTSGCGGLFYFPDKNVYFDPTKNGYFPQDVWFHSLDGTKLHGWWIPAKDAVGTIVQFHGNSQNLSSHFASLAWLTRERYNLFTFDYRGYGKSEGNPDAEGIYHDGMVALDTAWRLHAKQFGTRKARFVVVAQSLGVIIATRAFSDFRHQKETHALVLDSGFCSFKDMVQEKMATIWITWPFSPLGRLSVSDKYGCDTVLPEIQTPLLVVHDERDPVVDFSNSVEIFQRAGSSRKLFWKLSEGGHVSVFASEKKERRSQFLKYLSSGTL